MPHDSTRFDHEAVIESTRLWLEKAVIGLNLCPFAKAVHVKKQIRYRVTPCTTPEELLSVLVEELLHLSRTDPEQVDTTLLIHPAVLQDFLDYNDFLALANEQLAVMELEGEIQIASFHPDYQFAGVTPEAMENYTNRAPFPILHLLREASIDRAVAAFPDAAEIFERNIAKMNALGLDGWRSLFEQR
ncbi:DUF1415 domain-containing protein [Hydrocarboniclastica marina]|uniref:DUF1415 domain-containing protein n=1 Tax=Hydrocarboniclastica marina TaxID=2259620 RepID=A0A4P7XFS2_9ALTE|nr:DUF1415 domain-containing protein [Hydrocarboniclastica marina]QCF24587.1 DUF1415 domain-containing protein [Hydrocarboniclastica marina]